MAPEKPVARFGSWQVDARHSAAQLSTDGTTGFGKTKMTFTIGFGRVNGTVHLDSDDPSKSAFDFRFYPATSVDPPIDEQGKVKLEWFAHHANNTLVCFHSKGTQETADGRLKTTGTLTLTRVDRNVELTPNEAYAGPVYGPPILHRVSRQITFVFDAPSAATCDGQVKDALQSSGTTNVVREDFPQLLKAVIATHWPPVVREKNCQVVGAGEAYAGSLCTGTFVDAPALPLGPSANGTEDYPGPQNFNAVTGNQLSILVRLRLTPQSSGAQAGAGN
jgi:polyisoprenoid-binding protein YceI